MSGLKDRVAIIGMGCTRFGELWDKDPEDLIIESAAEAIADAGIEKNDLQAAWVGQACTGTSSGEGPLRMLLRSEGLFLSEGKAVTEAPEDFTHLPSCAGQRDISRNTRNTTLFPRNSKSAPVSAQGSNR